MRAGGAWAIRIVVLAAAVGAVMIYSREPTVKPGERMCRAQCECLSGSCSRERGFPFSDEAQCMDWCVDLDPAERICWHRWCVQAREAGEGSDRPGHDHAAHLASLADDRGEQRTDSDGFFDPVRLADAEPVTHYFHLCEHAWGAFGLDECNVLDP